MITRQLGKSGLAVAPLAFGGNVLGWTADEATSFKVLDAFVAAGFNLIDTADVYSRWIPGHQGGESETVLGKWMQSRGNRARVIIATKVGVEMGPGEQGLSRAYIMRAVDRSLARLKTDYIDLYQSHRDDQATPMEETLGAFADLIRAGKVRAIGASNFTAERLSAALATSSARGLPRYETLQPWYNLYDRSSFEGELAALCQREQLGVVSYFSLASGFLTGKYRTEADLAGRARAYRVKDMMNERGFRILRALDVEARKLEASPAQVSLAWLIARGVTAPIASATSVEQMQELAGSVRLELGSDALAALDEASRA
ncbi:MAG TPA: aldo/keto reductase [Steroidobacteraceae bacterium]|nr:aldo/keto reductase [Steroidobacteraceae bacterium]